MLLAGCNHFRKSGMYWRLLGKTACFDKSFMHARNVDLKSQLSYDLWISRNIEGMFDYLGLVSRYEMFILLTL